MVFSLYTVWDHERFSLSQKFGFQLSSVDFLFVFSSTSRNLAGIFMVLPTRKELPDYYQIIKHPVDIRKIRVSRSLLRSRSLERLRRRLANAPINWKVKHLPPRTFELMKIGLDKSPPFGAKKPFKCPTH